MEDMVVNTQRMRGNQMVVLTRLPFRSPAKAI